MDRLKVVVPFVPRVAPETRAALDELWPTWEAVPMAYDRQAYWRLFVKLWKAGDDFASLEHDVVPHSGVFPAFVGCPEWWCLFPYEAHDERGGLGRMLTECLGCVRFRAELMATRPGVMYAAGLLDMGSGPGHWARLSEAVLEVLAPLRPHVHEPPVGHVLRPY
jgi:hypothetical protein